MSGDTYTLSLHDALPVSRRCPTRSSRSCRWSTSASCATSASPRSTTDTTDRKSTRLNSSHSQISYAVFCLKKKNQYVEWHNVMTHWMLILLSEDLLYSWL